jgi:hypothetical protein
MIGLKNEQSWRDTLLNEPLKPGQKFEFPYPYEPYRSDRVLQLPTLKVRKIDLER